MAAGRRRRTRVRAAGAAVGAVALVGAVLGAGSVLRADRSVVDVAESAAEAEAARELTEAVEDTEDRDLAESGTTGVSEPLVAEEEPTLDEVLGFGGPTEAIVGVEDGFVGLRLAGSPVAIRSADGLAWTETPATGLPDEQLVVTGRLAHLDGSYAVLLQPVADLGDGFETRAFLARSSDGVAWTSVELDLPEVEGQLALNGAVLGPAGVLVTAGSYPEFIDPVGLALELGLIDEVQANESCGVSVVDGAEPIVIRGCDGSAVVTIETDDPAHAQLFEESTAVENPAAGRTITWSATGSEPLVRRELSNVSLAGETALATSEGFLLGGFGENGPTIRSSSDGVEWTLLPSPANELFGAAVLGNRLFSAEVRGAAAITATDQLTGLTEVTEVPVPDAMSDAWPGSAASGSAGVAILLTGSGIGDVFGDDFPTVVVEVDGYTVEVDLAGPLLVRGPDGEVIHDVEDSTPLFEDEQDVDGLARFQGQENSELVFVDPNTGDDLFTLTQDAFIGAMDLDQFDDIDQVATELALLFSRDGEQWQVLDVPSSDANSFSAVEAVGDDEVLIRVESFQVPPDDLFAFEQENRAPTEDEIAALDEWSANGQPDSKLIRIPVG